MVVFHTRGRGYSAKKTNARSPRNSHSTNKIAVSGHQNPQQKSNYLHRARITIITETPDDMGDHFDGTRGNDRNSQHSQKNEREYGHDDRHSSQPPSDGGESPSRSRCYDRDEDRESYRSGKTPYNNGGEEDSFNAGGAEDEESDVPASQRQGDYDNNAFEPEGQHDMRAARAQAHRSPDHAAKEYNE